MGIFDTVKKNLEDRGYAVEVFASGVEAAAYLEDNFSGKDGLKDRDCVKIYVDGSYNHATREFAYGMVVLKEDGEETYRRRFQDEELSLMRNVAGAMQYALDRGIAAIEIYHDYEGIAKWCLGEWKTNKEGTRAYKAFFDKASAQVKIRFVKVTGHSNDKYNDMADRLAKEALGIEEAGGAPVRKGSDRRRKQK